MWVIPNAMSTIPCYHHKYIYIYRWYGYHSRSWVVSGITSIYLTLPIFHIFHIFHIFQCFTNIYQHLWHQKPLPVMGGPHYWSAGARGQMSWTVSRSKRNGCSGKGEDSGGSFFVGLNMVKPYDFCGFFNDLRWQKWGFYLVGGLEPFLFLHILGINGNNSPNWLIFFRGVGIPPTSDSMNSVGLSNVGAASLDGHWPSNRWGTYAILRHTLVIWNMLTMKIAMFTGSLEFTNEISEYTLQCYFRENAELYWKLILIWDNFPVKFELRQHAWWFAVG